MRFCPWVGIVQRGGAALESGWLLEAVAAEADQSRQRQGTAVAAVLVLGPACMAVAADTRPRPASTDCALAGQGIQPTLLLAAQV